MQATILLLINYLQGNAPVSVSSPVVEGYCIVSEGNSSGEDRLYFARKRGAKLQKLVVLPIIRRDRNVPDLIFKRNALVVALVNRNVDMREPIFLRLQGHTWSIVPKPHQFSGVPGGNMVAILDGHLLGTVRRPSDSGKGVEYFMYQYSSKLTFNRIPDGYMDIRRRSSSSFELEHWRTDDSGKVIRKWEAFRWPLAESKGRWQLIHARSR